MQKAKFEELPISKEILKAVAEMGFEEPTPIQVQAVPLLLSGKDVIGQARTGTGKTAAFGIPLLEMVNRKSKDVQALILCPTRELAIQIAEELTKLAAHKKGAGILPVYGGRSIERQIRELRAGAQIVVGTPGRVLDHLGRGTLRTSGMKTVVLDEADEMLDMGFREDIEAILAEIPDNRTTVMFSATMSPEILKLSEKYMKSPEIVKVVHKELTVPGIEQIFFEVKKDRKQEVLSRIIDVYNPKLSLVFCATKKGVDELASGLQARGYLAEGLHGDLTQHHRERVMSKFRDGLAEVLVATDVAARGLDVEGVDAVFNYDVPNDVEYYVHRIGRTGRAGRSGIAFTFISGREIYKLREIQNYTKAKIKQSKIPTLEDVEKVRTNALLDEIKETLEAGDMDKYVRMALDFVKDDMTSMDLAAALLKIMLDKDLKDESTENDFSDRIDGEGEKVRLVFNVGKLKNAGPGDFVGAIAGETRLPGKIVGSIDIFDDHTIVAVRKEFASEVIRSMNGKKIKGVRLKVDYTAKKGKRKYD